MVRRLLRVSVVGAVALCLSATFSPAASAAVPANFCDGKSEETVVRTYSRGSLAIPLRCGTNTYGFRHVVQKGRWNDAFDSRIANTIARGTVNAAGTIYGEMTDRCVNTFRVVVNQGAIGGSGFRPQGVITAYEVTYPNTASVRPEGVVPAQRTDCLIYEPVAEP
ncbi:hypothetical protein GCM10023175_22550 [Pseudonocardia xishanensis]|uniref:Secreted protein n=1 Tax=Pseudonocardia xishanensis TaxID=630995 RepID=A0ABP8RRJ9_9PSEU